jgi:hypothetical protein
MAFVNKLLKDIFTAFRGHLNNFKNILELTSRLNTVA